jgi:hypothetical protein
VSLRAAIHAEGQVVGGAVTAGAAFPVRELFEVADARVGLNSAGSSHLCTRTMGRISVGAQDASASTSRSASDAATDREPGLGANRHRRHVTGDGVVQVARQAFTFEQLRLVQLAPAGPSGRSTPSSTATDSNAPTSTQSRHVRGDGTRRGSSHTERSTG